MTFCTNCGSKVSGEIKFCPNCGAKITAKEPIAPIQETPKQLAQTEQTEQAEAPIRGSYIPPTQQSYTAPVQQGYVPPTQTVYAPSANEYKQRKPLNKKLLLIIGGAVFTVILAIALIGMLGGKGDNSEGQSVLHPSVAGVQQNQDGGSSGVDADNFKEQWVGTWYGVFDVMDGTGKYEANAYQRYDAYMVVSVDANGEGRFAVYLDGGSLPFATGTCTAKDNALLSVEGLVLGAPMNTDNWMFLPVPDTTDEYCVSDELADADGDTLEYNFFFKPWGADWNPDPAERFPIVPPGLDVYNGRITNGEQPPYGAAK